LVIFWIRAAGVEIGFFQEPACEPATANSVPPPAAVGRGFAGCRACMSPLSALFGPHVMSDLSPECAPKWTSATLNVRVHALRSLDTSGRSNSQCGTGSTYWIAPIDQELILSDTSKSVRFSLRHLAHPGFCDPKTVAPKTRFHERVQRDLGRPVPPRKKISLVPSGKSTPLIAASSPTRGASRSSRTLGAGCDGRAGA
jgi:hypothetical protein